MIVIPKMIFFKAIVIPKMIIFKAIVTKTNLLHKDIKILFLKIQEKPIKIDIFLLKQVLLVIVVSSALL